MQICYCNSNRTTLFAAGELKKYLSLMGNSDIRLCQKDQAYQKDTETITLGTFSELNIQVPPKDSVSSLLDDHIIVKVEKGTGIIAGANYRSILLGVYAFLTGAGLRWIRPGSSGEVIVHKNFKEISFNIDEKPTYRHRGICIEGANSIDNVLDLIDWLPKVGMNSYFIQFREAFTFFDRWYSHLFNQDLGKTGFSVEDARHFVKMIEDELDKRDMIYHAVGHGWTCEPFGIPGTGWDKVDESRLPAESFQYFAEIDGKRSLWRSVPLDTNLCYSNPDVPEIIAKDITAYLKEHPRVDLLHLWLADGANNHCECENCQKALPSDFYVKLLNLVDEYLTRNNIDTKVVFLIYVDLLWAPEKERFNNPDRFVLMFAPITRTYAASFATENPLPDLPEYKRNQLKMPKRVEENIAFLKSWQEIFKGDSFDFDYHMIWDHYMDPGYYFNANILYQDIKNLKKVGLNGFNSCQVQRAFFPTGFPMYVMAKTLWNSEMEFEDIAEEYFKASFGEYGPKVSDYLKTLSDLFDPLYIRREKNVLDQDSLSKFKKIPEHIHSFKKTIREGMQYPSYPISQSFYYLNIHADGALLYAKHLESAASGAVEDSKRYLEAYLDYYRKNEMLVQNVFDVYEFINTIHKKKYWD